MCVCVCVCVFIRACMHRFSSYFLYDIIVCVFKLKDTISAPNHIKVPSVSACGTFFASPHGSGMRLFSLPRILKASCAGNNTVTDPANGILNEQQPVLAVDVRGLADVGLSSAEEVDSPVLCTAFSPVAPVIATGSIKGRVALYQPR